MKRAGSSSAGWIGIFTQDRARRDAMLERGFATPEHADFVAKLAAAGAAKTRR
jgi:hypothetical protein